MFYCNECAEKNGYPQTLSKSEGRCEICGEIALCNDRPSLLLGESQMICDDASLIISVKRTSESNDAASKIKVICSKFTSSKKGKYPIIDVPANGKPNWYGGAYTLAFVYSKHQGNFILRGYGDEVDKYLKKHYTHYFCYVSMWHNGRSRGIWKFWKDRVYIYEPRRSRNYHELRRDKFVVHKYGEGGKYNDFSELKKEKEIKLEFKRLPKRWIPEFDTL